MNPRTEKKKAIATLHPSIRGLVTAGVNKTDMALAGRAKIIIVQALRTFRNRMHYLRNDQKLPMQKHTNPITTTDWHLTSACKLMEKDISWDTAKDWDGDHIADWMEVATIFSALGFKWGKHLMICRILKFQL